MIFIDWQLKNPPIFSFSTPEDHNDSSYLSAMKLMEKSVYELTLTYLKRSVNAHSQAGDLLLFVRELSSRCFDLYQAIVDIESQNNIPPLSKEAGELKAFTFTTEEINIVKSGAQVYLNTANEIINVVKNHEESAKKYEILIKCLIFNQDSILSELGFEYCQLNELTAIFHRYRNSLDETSQFLIQKLHVMLGNIIQKFSYDKIYAQLSQLINAQPETRSDINDVKSALLREIESRIIGSSFSDERAIGFMRDPETYLKILTGENITDLNEEGEFRLRMYFIYKTIHFISRIIESNSVMNNINDWLNSHNKSWRIDFNYVQALLQSEGDGYHAMYRYGAHAHYMSTIRKTGCCRNLPSYSKSGDTFANTPYFLEKLSKKEQEELSRRRGMSPIFITGAHIFEPQQDLASHKTPPPIEEECVIKYVESVRLSGMPVSSAGPSGAAFQIARIARFVGLCQESNKDFWFEVQMLKLACLAFMLPGDHTVHEVMIQFSNLFGNKYEAGPGYEKYIYPNDTAYVSYTLKVLQSKKRSYVPHWTPLLFPSNSHHSHVTSTEGKQLPQAVNENYIKESTLTENNQHQLGFF